MTVGTPRPRRRTVVALFGGISSLTGGGGAERYFAHVLTRYQALPDRRYDVLIATDRLSISRLEAVGEKIDLDHVMLLPESGRLAGNLGYARALRRIASDRHVDLVYVPLVNPRYLLALAILRRNRETEGPRIGINVLDCTMAHRLGDVDWQQKAAKVYALYDLFFRFARPDGLFTPYELFRVRYVEAGVGQAVVARMNSFLVDFERFAPSVAKSNTVVWAGRLDSQKQPLLFVKAIDALRRADPQLFARWRFAMYGRGPLEDEIRRAISGLGDRVALDASPHMHEVFAASRVFVSTQDFENYSSMAMLEAMAAGNAIVARPVGETAHWVQAGVNGVLAADDTPSALAAALASIIADDASMASMGKRSRDIAVAMNSFANVVKDLEGFFDLVLTS